MVAAYSNAWWNPQILQQLHRIAYFIRPSRTVGIRLVMRLVNLVVHPSWSEVSEIPHEQQCRGCKQRRTQLAGRSGSYITANGAEFAPDYLRNKYGPPVLALGGARTDRPLTSSVERRYGDKLQQCASLNQLSEPSLSWARWY